MPFVRVSYLENQYESEQLTQISRVVMQVLIQHFDVPEDDCFQVFHSHKASEFVYSRNYLNIERSDGLIYFQITLKSGRSTEKKTSFYSKLAELLSNELKIRKEDVFVMLIETEFEDWTFGNGEAQMLQRMTKKVFFSKIEETVKEK
ncbi:tautomerase family protein [Paenibacillus agricola]|uniref:Tautomerase family protein n=1 Tax=Paenibacillus agricola TaxID=2716264 RepID=A0ABX0J9P3_9BACL|nr:tautomerase family protein [Paenibacillus agricola]NHN31513.1 tautomerase family protein [Paenibacillus agricola]